MAEEDLAPALTTDNICQDLRFFEVENHHCGCTPYAMRKRRPCLLMCGFAVYHYGVATRSQLCTALPHLLDKRAGRIVGVRVNATRGQRFLDLQSRTKGRYNDDICRSEFVPWDQLLTGRGENKPYPALLQVPVNIGIVDHLAEEKHAAVGVGFQRSIGNIHSVFHAETEAKVAGQNKAYGTEIEHGWEQIPLAWVLHLACLFDARNHRTFVKNRDIKLSCHSCFIPIFRHFSPASSCRATVGQWSLRQAIIALVQGKSYRLIPHGTSQIHCWCCVLKRHGYRQLPYSSMVHRLSPRWACKIARPSCSCSRL